MSNSKTQREASNEINTILQKISEDLKKAEAIANEHNLPFFFNPTGAYGAGAWYTPPRPLPEAEERDDNFSELVPGAYDEESGWQSSSSSC